MKNIKQIARLLLVLVMLVTSVAVFTACGGTGKISEASITYDGYSISWGEADKATSYTVSINGAEFVTTITTYGYTASQSDQTVTVKITPVDKKGKEGDSVTKTFSRLGDVTNLQFDENGVLTWDSVNGASAYIVSVNGQEFTVNECRYADFDSGKSNTIKVRATTTTNNTFSFFSETVSAFYLNAPTDVKYDGTTLSWKGSSKATAYEVYINGSLLDTVTTSTAQYSASDDFSVEVRAIGNSNNKVFDSGLSVAEEYIYLNQVVEYNVDSGKLTWEAVEDATSYQVYVNNTLITTTTNEYDNLYTGRNNIVKVLPVGQSKEHTHYFSSWSNEWNIFILNYPTTNWNNAIVPDNGVAVSNFGWQAVTGEIAGYEVKVTLPDGSSITERCSELTYSFPYAFEAVGTYYISVKTLADNASGSNYYDSSYSPEIVVTRLAAPNRAPTFITSINNNVSAGFSVFIQNDTKVTGYQIWREGTKISSTVANNATGGVREIKITDIYDPTIFTEQQISFSIQSLGKLDYVNNQTIVTLPSNTNNSLDFTVTVLAVPQDIDIDGDVMMWNSVTGANGYYVTGDGGTLADNATYSLKNLSAGSHDMQVCAIGNGAEILASPYSVVIKAFKLHAPTDVRIGQTGESEGKLLFTGVEYASSYDVIQDGKETNISSDNFDNIYKSISTSSTSIALVAVANYYNEATQTHYVTSDPSNVINVFKLAAPTMGANGMAYIGTELIWNSPWNANASVYAPMYELYDAAKNIYYDGLINATKKDLASFSAGTYQFQVRAIGDGISCINSDWSEVSEITKLESPTLTWSEDLKAYKFSAVDMAQHYVISIDGKTVYTANANGPFFYVPTELEKVGTYTVSIVATSDSAMTSAATTIKQQVKKLSAPTFNFGYTENCYSPTGKIFVKASTVANASGYIFFVGGHASDITSNIINEGDNLYAYYEYNTQATGEFKCGVQAVGGMFDTNGIYYISSDIAGNNDANIINILGTPSGAKETSTRLSWSTCNGALTYKVIIRFTDGTFTDEIDTNGNAYVSIADYTSQGKVVAGADIQAIGNGITKIDSKVYTYIK